VASEPETVKTFDKNMHIDKGRIADHNFNGGDDAWKITDAHLCKMD